MSGDLLLLAVAHGEASGKGGTTEGEAADTLRRAR
jgi:hypothetical protein